MPNPNTLGAFGTISPVNAFNIAGAAVFDSEALTRTRTERCAAAMAELHPVAQIVELPVITLTPAAIRQAQMDMCRL